MTLLQGDAQSGSLFVGLFVLGGIFLFGLVGTVITLFWPVGGKNGNQRK